MHIRLARRLAQKGVAEAGSSAGWSRYARTAARQWLGPLTLGRPARRLRSFIDQIQPDLVHAMRIPFEGCWLAGA
jgi:hypothetical protein